MRVVRTLDWAFVIALFALLAALAVTSCITAGPSGPAVLSEASSSMYRLTCQCGGVAWVRVEFTPRLRVTVTSENAPLGIPVQLDEDGVVALKCGCGWTHYLMVRAGSDGVLIGILYSEPPDTGPPRKEPVMA